MERDFVLGLGSITLLVIGLVIYFGLKLSRAVRQRAPESDLTVRITPAGIALFACMMGFWIVCVASRVLAPQSALGAFLSRADGVAAVLAGSVFFCGIGAAILEKLGYPIAMREGGSP